MASRTTILLHSAAVIFGGILAGLDVGKSVVEMPALRQLAVEEWANYSRNADLGTGLLLFPSVALLGPLPTFAALLSARGDRLARGRTAMAYYAAAALTVGGLVVTAKAAPIMLALRDANLGIVELRAAFDGFEFWHNLRTIVQTSAFLAMVWALVAFLGPFER